MHLLYHTIHIFYVHTYLYNFVIKFANLLIIASSSSENTFASIQISCTAILCIRITAGAVMYIKIYSELEHVTDVSNTSVGMIWNNPSPQAAILSMYSKTLILRTLNLQNSRFYERKFRSLQKEIGKYMLKQGSGIFPSPQKTRVGFLGKTQLKKPKKPR
jgi:hypothetical protein